jgi:uncharacterized protein with PIN domain
MLNRSEELPITTEQTQQTKEHQQTMIMAGKLYETNKICNSCNNRLTKIEKEEKR